MDELIDIYDQDNRPLGLRKMKSEAHRDGLWHRASHVWIYNSQGEILMQLRAKDKDVRPDRWDVSAAGHIMAGEEPEIAALRETMEEIGLELSLPELEFYKIMKSDGVAGKITNREHQYVYFFRFDGRAENLVLQAEEVHAVRFFSAQDMEEEIRTADEGGIGYKDYWLEIMGEVKRRMEGRR